MKSKLCRKCKIIKPLEDFSEIKNINKTETVYRKSNCKSCMSLRAREWAIKNRERFNKYHREYYSNNK